jgi:hypothetical protein
MKKKTIGFLIIAITSLFVLAGCQTDLAGKAYVTTPSCYLSRWGYSFSTVGTNAGGCTSAYTHFATAEEVVTSCSAGKCYPNQFVGSSGVPTTFASAGASTPSLSTYFFTSTMNGTNRFSVKCQSNTPSGQYALTTSYTNAWCCTNAPTATVETVSTTANVSTATINCTDSDNGNNYYVKGSCYDNKKYFASNPLYDECNPDNASILRELYCRKDGYCDNPQYVCLNGCKDGACINSTNQTPTIQCAKAGLSATVYGGPNKQCCQGLVLQGGICNVPTATTTTNATTTNTSNTTTTTTYPCTDSDGGKNYSVYGEIKETHSDGTWMAGKDECWGVLGQTLSEKYCENGKISVESAVECRYGCSKGACLTKMPTCYDSDTPNDLNVKGYATIDGGTTKIYDFCASEVGSSNKTALTQTYCDSSNKIQAKFYDCPNGCKDGACITITNQTKAPQTCYLSRWTYSFSNVGTNAGGCTAAYTHFAKAEEVKAACSAKKCYPDKFIGSNGIPTTFASVGAGNPSASNYYFTSTISGTNRYNVKCQNGVSASRTATSTTRAWCCTN